MGDKLTRLGLGALIVVQLLAGCDRRTPTEPFPSSQVTATPLESWTIAGTVWVHDRGSVKPAQSGAVFGWVEHEQFATNTGKIPIAANGRYQFSVHRSARRVHIQTWGVSEYQPCAASVEPTGDVNVDVHAGTLPESLRFQESTLSGRVYELNPDGRRVPVGEAEIALDSFGGEGFVLATTFTDADGRYALCAVPQLQGLFLSARAPGYALFGFGDGLIGRTTLDIELRRK